MFGELKARIETDGRKSILCDVLLWTQRSLVSLSIARIRSGCCYDMTWKRKKVVMSVAMMDERER